jgi:signal transduction histidine kinase
MSALTTDLPPDEPETADELAAFSAQVAHDFNNLLTGMLGNLELMQSRATRTGVTSFDAYLEGARNSANRAAAFAQRLLAFSGRAMDDFAPVSVHTLLSSLAKPPIAITNLAPNARIFCDPAQAERALAELLDNAIDATREHGAITITSTILNDTVLITVRDTGHGMTPEIADRAMEPFFTTRPNGAGKGLGLPIAARFAQLAGGALELSSAPGQGTSVTLRLPSHPA